MNNSKIKVDVNLDEIEQQAIILNLADKPLLNGEELNDEDDILENEEIKQRDKLEFKQKVEEKKKKMNQVQKWEYVEEGNKAGVLDKYDELKMEKEGFYLDQSGRIVESDQKQLEQIKSKLKSSQNNNQYSLLFEDRIANDYKSSIPNSIMKKKISKKTSNIVEQPIDKKQPIEEQEFEDDYTLLQKSIESKMRQKVAQSIQNQTKIEDLLVQNTKNIEIKTEDDEFVKPSIRSMVGEVQEINVISTSTDFLSNVKTEVEVEESRKINPNYTIKDQLNGIASIVNIQLPSERIRKQLVQDTKQEEGIEEEEEEEIREKIEEKIEQDIQEEVEQEIQQNTQVNNNKEQENDVGFLDEMSHGSGLANTLRILRERGELRHDNYNFVGRNKDEKRVSDLDQKDDEIRLEYRDQSGRLMTPKEAFRYQCWKFHGEGPSKNKIEKRKKRELLQQRQRKYISTETPLMKALKEQQKNKKTSYMVIGKKNM